MVMSNVLYLCRIEELIELATSQGFNWMQPVGPGVVVVP